MTSSAPRVHQVPDDGPLRVRDHRQPGWGWFDYAVVDAYGPQIGADGLAVYMVLCRHVNHGTQKARPSLATIQHKTRLGRHKVIAMITLLEEVGLIEKDSRPVETPTGTTYHQSNEYTLLNVGGSAPTALPSAPSAPPPSAPTALPSAPSAPEQDRRTRSIKQDPEREAPAPTAPSLSPVEAFGLDEFTTAITTVPGAATINAAEQHALLRDAWAGGTRPAPHTTAQAAAQARTWARRAVAYAAAHPERTVTTDGPHSPGRDAADLGPAPGPDPAFTQRLAALAERAATRADRPAQRGAPRLP